jgi:TM2 domain-containing membrane protein YozV
MNKYIRLWDKSMRGRIMNYDEENVSSKSQMVTLFLLLFFGSFGVHRFYTNKYITGIIYLIIGSISFALNLFGFSFAYIIQLAFKFLILIDLRAIYSDSFTDSEGRLIVGKSSVLVYNSYEERDQNIFLEKVNKIVFVSLAIALYLTYFIIINFIL